MTAERGHEHQTQMDPKHPADLQDIVADQDEEHALHECEDAERQDFREHVIRQTNVEIALALQDRRDRAMMSSALLVRREEHGHNQTQEENVGM